MTRNDLLEQLRAFTFEVTADLIMPVKPQKEDGGTPPDPRAADVYLMRLPDSKSAMKKSPYIIHQLITSKDIQPTGQRGDSRAVVRSIFSVYNDDEQEGGLMLLNLQERFRIALLRKVIIGKRYQLDLEAGLEALLYPDDTAPFFAGEMVSTWRLPSIEREVQYGN